MYDLHDWPSSSSSRPRTSANSSTAKGFPAPSSWYRRRSDPSFTGEGTRGLTFERRWTRPGVHPYDEITWEFRTAGISSETGKTVFKHEQRVGVMSLVTTGGGLVFGGDVAGNFRALDDKTGEVLWETNIGSPVSGYPVSFAVEGKQYVAVTTGPSLVAMASRRMTPELPGDAGAGRIVVFALP